MATGLENLEIHELAKKLELRVYECTKTFPPDEKYRSVDQLRRSSSSVINNIAESYVKSSLKEKIHILRDRAIAEAEETKSNILQCAEKKFLPPETAKEMANGYVLLMKRINGYIKFLRKFGSQTDNRKPTN